MRRPLPTAFQRRVHFVIRSAVIRSLAHVRYLEAYVRITACVQSHTHAHDEAYLLTALLVNKTFGCRAWELCDAISSPYWYGFSGFSNIVAYKTSSWRPGIEIKAVGLLIICLYHVHGLTSRKYRDNRLKWRIFNYTRNVTPLALFPVHLQAQEAIERKISIQKQCIGHFVLVMLMWEKDI